MAELKISNLDVAGSSPVARSKKSSEQKRAHYREYYRTNKDKYRAKRKRYEGGLRALILVAKEKPCIDCSGQWPPIIMELDHREGEIKLFNIGDWLSQRRVGRKGLEAEIAKCDVLCPTCHRIRTMRWRGLL